MMQHIASMPHLASNGQVMVIKLFFAFLGVSLLCQIVDEFRPKWEWPDVTAPLRHLNDEVAK